MVNSGFMTRKEIDCFLSIKSDVNLYWVPGMWFIHLLRTAKKEGRIRDPQGVKLITEVKIRKKAIMCNVLHQNKICPSDQMSQITNDLTEVWHFISIIYELHKCIST